MARLLPLPTAPDPWAFVEFVFILMFPVPSLAHPARMSRERRKGARKAGTTFASPSGAKKRLAMTLGRAL